MPGTGSEMKSGGKSKEDGARTADALDEMPTWLDRAKVSKTMSKRKKRKEAETTRDNFAKKANSLYYTKRISRVWKAATKEYLSNQTSDTPKKHGFGARAVALKYNLQLQSPGDRKIGRRALQDAMKSGEVGVSPKKRGKPATVPGELTMGIATHAAMM